MSGFAGIDPGVNGAVAVISVDGLVLELFDAPFDQALRSYDRDRVALICAAVALRLPDRVAIELVGGLPTDGGSRAFNFGMGYEIWLSGLHYAGIRPEKISPMKWKGKLSLPGRTKDPAAKKLSVLKAREVFPDCADRLSRWRDDGRAEALLIAHYLRLTSFSGITSISKQHGRDSPQAIEAILGGLNRFNRRMRGSGEMS